MPHTEDETTSVRLPEEALHARDFVLVETSDFPSSNADGSVTVADGEEQSLVEYEPPTGNHKALIHAFGATDAADVQYRLRFGGEEISFTAESSLGGVNDPFSFVDVLGKPLTAGTGTVQFTAINTSGSPIDLVARMFLEAV